MAMSVRASAESLRLIPLFHHCDPVPLQVMAFAAVSENFRDGDVIVKEGSIVEGAFFLVSGKAAVTAERRAIGEAEPGSLLGEVSMLSKRPSQVTATAIGNVVTARIDYELFLRVANEYPDFGQAVLGALSARLEHSMREFDSVRVLLNKSRAFSDL